MILILAMPCFLMFDILPLTFGFDGLMWQWMSRGGDPAELMMLYAAGSAAAICVTIANML